VPVVLGGCVPVDGTLGDGVVTRVLGKLELGNEVLLVPRPGELPKPVPVPVPVVDGTLSVDGGLLVVDGTSMVMPVDVELVVPVEPAVLPGALGVVPVVELSDGLMLDPLELVVDGVVVLGLSCATVGLACVGTPARVTGASDRDGARTRSPSGMPPRSTRLPGERPPVPTRSNATPSAAT
jgi:hypothetical protein